MHYATLVTVEVEHNEEDLVRVIGAAKLMQEIEEKKRKAGSTALFWKYTSLW